MGLGLPAFQNMLQGGLQGEVKRLTGILRLLRNEAVLTRKPFQLVFDLDAGSYRVMEVAADGTLLPRDEPAEFRPHALPAEIHLREFDLFGAGGQKVRTGEVGVRVDASGFMDPFVLRFTDGDVPYALRVATLAGRLELLQGEDAER